MDNVRYMIHRISIIITQIGGENGNVMTVGYGSVGRPVDSCRILFSFSFCVFCF